MTQVQPIAFIFTLPEDALPAVNRRRWSAARSASRPCRATGTELDHGTITLLDNQIDQTTGTIRLKATFPNPHKRSGRASSSMPGCWCAPTRDALTMPSAAIQRGPDGMFTYVVSRTPPSRRAR